MAVRALIATLHGQATALAGAAEFAYMHARDFVKSHTNLPVWYQSMGKYAPLEVINLHTTGPGKRWWFLIAHGLMNSKFDKECACNREDHTTHVVYSEQYIDGIAAHDSLRLNLTMEWCPGPFCLGDDILFITHQSSSSRLFLEKTKREGMGLH